MPISSLFLPDPQPFDILIPAVGNNHLRIDEHNIAVCCAASTAIGGGAFPPSATDRRENRNANSLSVRAAPDRAINAHRRFPRILFPRSKFRMP